MKYSGTLLAVRDINVSRRFYEDIFGLELFQDYGINISFKGGLSLQQEFHWLAGIPKEEVMTRSKNMELYFEDRYFDRFLDKLARHPEIELLGGVVEHSWGQRVVRFFDPDGHIMEVGESMVMVIHRFQQEGMTMEEISKRMDVSVSDLKRLLDAEQV